MSDVSDAELTHIATTTAAMACLMLVFSDVYNGCESEEKRHTCGDFSMLRYHCCETPWRRPQLEHNLMGTISGTCCQAGASIMTDGVLYVFLHRRRKN